MAEKRRWIAVIGALALATVPASTTMASPSLDGDSSSVTAGSGSTVTSGTNGSVTLYSDQGWSLSADAGLEASVSTDVQEVDVHPDASVEFEGLIPVGFATEDDAESCAYQGSCPELEGVAFTDLQLSDPPPDGFEVYNGLTSSVTKWLACTYDDGSLVDCYYDDYFGGGLVVEDGRLDSSIDELRLMPYHASYNNYHIDFYS